MDTAVVLLFVAGLALWAVEVFVPGGVLGVAGALSLMAGVGLSFTNHGTTGGLIALASVIMAGLLLLYVEMRLLPRTALGRRMFLKKSIDGVSQSRPTDNPDDLVGREALALTALAPTGVVDVAGRRYEARCESGFADPGMRLRVRRVESFHLVVIASD